MEAPMKRKHFIGLDSHGSFCLMAVLNQAGKVVQQSKCKTAMDTLREIIGKVPAPRNLVFEEGPLANWLYRNLVEHVEELTVAEPRRNRLIACEGDKDDPVDAAKLADLLRGGFIKSVHQTATLAETLFKQLVAQ